MNIIDISLIIVFFVNVILSTIIFIDRKERSGSSFFAISAYSTALWVFAMFLFRNINDLTILILPTKLLYIAGISIATNFLYFSYTFLDNFAQRRIKLFFLISLPVVISIALIIFSGAIIKDVTFIENEKIVTFGKLYYPYSFLMFAYFIWAYLNLFKKFKRFKNSPIERLQLLYVVAGTFISIIIGLLYDIVVPAFGDFTFYWFGPVMTIMFVTATSYSILKHRLFNARVIATELLTFAIWIFILVRTLLADTLQERLINFGLLGFVVVFGILLIRSVLREVEQRERLQKLSEELKEANERLREFLAFAAHDLKNPIALIKQLATLIYDKTYTEPKQIEETTQKIKITADRAVRLIESFLDLRSLESGQLKYDFEEKNIVEFVRNVAGDFAPLAEQRGLEFSFNSAAQEIKTKIDTVKMRQVIQNLLDNALKYTQSGFIKVEVKDEGETALISITDSGLGMKAEILPTLFEQFRRAPGVERKIAGTGLGLFISKQFVLGHKGKIAEVE